MGKVKENPRYNVVSVRVSDELIARIELGAKRANMSKSEFLSEVLNGVFVK